MVARSAGELISGRGSTTPKGPSPSSSSSLDVTGRRLSRAASAACISHLGWGGGGGQRGSIDAWVGEGRCRELVVLHRGELGV